MGVASVRAWSATLLFSTAVSTSAAELTVDDIRSCSLKNLVDRGSIRNLEVTTTDREGKSESLRAKLFWKPTPAGQPRVNVHVVEPTDLAGSSFLLLPSAKGGDIQFAYLANSRIGGTKFDYGELEQLREVFGNGSSRRRPDAKVSGRSVFVIESGPPKIVSYIDQSTCVLLKSELFEKSGELRKVLEADVGSLLSVEPYWLALKFTLRDLREGTQTVISLGDLYLKERLSEKVFAPESFFEDVD